MVACPEAPSAVYMCGWEVGDRVLIGRWFG